MTKKKAEEIVEPKPIEKAVVSVEMTEAEKAEFVAYKAKKQSDQEKVKEAEEIIEIRLKFGHLVNGVAYGPGLVRVRSDLGYSLLHADEGAVKARLKVHESNSFMIEIIGQGKSIVRKVQ